MNTHDNDEDMHNNASTPTPSGDAYSNAEKDPDEWITEAEEMTGAQKSYLKTLSAEAGEDFDETLSKAAASKRIEELQQKTGRGLKE